jgi:AraC family transcriptional regulator
VKKQLIVDYTKKDASLKIFPSKPLLSTNNKHVQFEYHKLSANEVPEHLPAQHAIVILHDPSKRVCRRMGGKLQVEFAKPGNIVISPANVCHYVSWDDETSFSILFLNPKSIALTAYEFIDPDRVELLPHFARPDPVIYEIGQMLKSRLESGLPTSQVYIDQLSSFLAVHLLENYCSIEHKLVGNNHSFSRLELQQVFDYFDAHIDRQISLTEISELLGMSQYHFGRLFKQAVGIPSAQYLLNKRLEKTAQLLRSTNLDLQAIARGTGFSSRNHLCAAFKDRFSITPNKYRKSF